MLNELVVREGRARKNVVAKVSTVKVGVVGTDWLEPWAEVSNLLRHPRLSNTR